MTKMPETTTGWKTKSHQFSLHGILKLATSGRQPGFVASPVGGDSTSGRGGPIGGRNPCAGHGSLQIRDRSLPECDYRANFIAIQPGNCGQSSNSADDGQRRVDRGAWWRLERLATPLAGATGHQSAIRPKTDSALVVYRVDTQS